MPDLDTDCELVWAKMNLKGNGNIYICTYYRRNVTDEESIRNFETSVTRASAINNATLIIGGDMNFPGWNWKENTLKPNSTAPNLHTDFMDVLNNNALTQLVEEPTRQQNTLDLILTNHPGKVIRTDTSRTMTSYTQNLTSDQSSYNKNHGPSLYTTKLTGME